MNRDTIRQWVNVLAFVAVVVVNALANALPLNGQNTGEISDRFKVFFVPAGYVFAIWGVIYLLLLGFTIYQALPSQRTNPRLRRIGYLFALSSLANGVWIFLWHYNVFGLTLVAMLTLLVTLIAIYLRIGTGQGGATPAERWLVQIPFSVYLGWITVATIANVTDVLYWAGWSGWGISGPAWAVIMLLAGTVIASLVAITRRDIAYVLVILWAYAGIVVKQAATPLVAYTAAAAAAVIALVLIATLVQRPRRPA